MEERQEVRPLRGVRPLRESEEDLEGPSELELSDEEATEPTEEAKETEERSVSVYDPLHRYLMEIRKYPFLTREEEVRLAILSKSTNEDALQAITDLVLSHLRFVASIAMEYRHLPFDTMDLIQEGNIGLMQAIKKFDPYRNIRVATYAAWWIRAYILKYLLQNWRLVKIGTTEVQRKLFFNLSKEREKLEKLGYVAGPKLLADRLNVKEDEVIDVERRMKWGQEVSLDATYGEKESERSLMETLPSGEEGVEQKAAKEQLARLFQTKLKEFSQTLDLRDKKILSDRILSEQPMTLDALGVLYKISKERVRQLEENLVKKLKRFMKQELKDFEDITP
ncbi:MAG: RNA polymerase factor sigma-32 [Nitrospirae bacterium]|nr:RNA polymerase factor sigma-32 [Candidatus Troglogloeales bacterium]